MREIFQYPKRENFNAGPMRLAGKRFVQPLLLLLVIDI
jgi:hypothetical protein